MAKSKVPAAAWWPPPAIAGAIAILAVGGGFTALLHQFLHDREDAAAFRQFRAEAQVISREVRDVFRRSTGLTNTAAALVRTTPRMDAAVWHGFVSELRPFEANDGLVGYAIVEQVPSGSVDAFAERMKREGQGNVRVFPAKGEGPYWPVAYAEPEQLRRRVVGFDLGAEPNRQRTMREAADHALATMSGLIGVNFLDEADASLGYLVFYPLYSGEAAPATVAERRARLRGFAMAAYRFDQLLDGIANTGHGRYSLSLFDLGGEEPVLAYQSTSPAAAADLDYRRQIDFESGGHLWRLDIAASRAYLRQIDRQYSTLAMALGGLITLVAASLFHTLSSGRQRAEALAERMTTELRVSEERFRALTKLSSDWYWEQDENHRFTTVVVGDDAVARGVPVVLGRCRWEMPIELPAEEWSAHRAILDARLPFRDFEFRVRADDGGWRWRSVSGEPRFDSQGRFIGYRGTGRDITERKAFEQDLALRSYALDQVHEQAHLFDDDHRIIYANEESCRALGYSREEVMRMSVFDFDPDVSVEDFAALQEAMRVTMHASIESRHRRRDGTTFPVEVELSSFTFQGRHFVLTLSKDISLRRSQEEELRRHRDHLQELVAERTRDLQAAMDEAEHANRAKSEFLANVTHELRTPMHAILSYASLGRDRLEQVGVDKLLGYFDRIHDSGERLLGLIDQLLDLSKFEAGRMLLDPKPADAVALCRAVAADLAALAAARGQRIEVAATAGIGSIEVDAERISQVLRNLLANAMRFSPDGGEIVVTLAPAELPGRRAGDQGTIPALRIAVADRGIGIPEAELESIFDAFVQSSRTSTGAGGTGLGLAICRQVVHAHNGRIRAHNRPGGGAEFDVLLPVR